MKKNIFIFLSINILLSVYFIDLWSNAQNNSRMLPLLSLFSEGKLYFDEHHTLTGDKAVINGHYYSDKPPLPSLVTAIPFGIFEFTGLSGNDFQTRLKIAYIIGNIVVGIIPFLILIWLTFLNIRMNNSSDFEYKSMLFAMLPFYCTFLFVFNGTLFAHLFSAMLALVSYIFLKKKSYYYFGLFAGLAFLSEFTLILLTMVWLMQMIIVEKKLPPLFNFIKGFFPAIGLLLIYNYIISGNPFSISYQHVTDDYAEMKTNFGFSIPKAEALWGLSFSLFRGIFIYAPVLLVLIWALLKNHLKTNRTFKLSSFFFEPLAFPLVIYFLFISSYYMWWGGWTFGPRHLTIIVILLIFEGIVVVSKEKKMNLFFYISLILGFLISFSSKVTLQYSLPTESKNPIFDLILPSLSKASLNENNLPTLLFNLPPIVSASIWLLLFISSILIIRKFISHEKA